MGIKVTTYRRHICLQQQNALTDIFWQNWKLFLYTVFYLVCVNFHCSCSLLYMAGICIVTFGNVCDPYLKSTMELHLMQGSHSKDSAYRKMYRGNVTCIYILSTVCRKLPFQVWFMQDKKYVSYFRLKCRQFAVCVSKI